MKRNICLLLILILIFNAIVMAASADLRNWIDVSDYDFANVDINDYTTTYIRPYLVNWHLTTPKQASLDYKGGETGQRCRAGAISQKNSEIVLIGGDTWGLSRSEDGGVTWYPSSKGIEVQGISAISFYPDLENIVFALATNNTTTLYKETGIYKSSDAGKTWSLVYEGFNNKYGVSDRMIVFSDPDENGARKIYIASQNGAGIVMSSDMGKSWVKLNQPKIDGVEIDSISITVMKYHNNELIFSSSNYGMWKTNDDGQNWVSLNENITATNVDEINTNSISVRSFDIDKKTGNWYAFYNEWIVKSIDNGITWVKAHSSWLSRNDYIGELIITNPDKNGETVLLLGCENTSPSVYYSTNFNADGTMTFNAPNTDAKYSFEANVKGYSKPEIILNTAENNGAVVFFSMGDTICKSIDSGRTIEASSSGHSGYRITDMYFNPEDENDIAMSFIDHGFARTVDVGKNGEYPLVSKISKTKLSYTSSGTAHSTSYTIDKDPKDSKRWIVSIGTWSDCVIAETKDNGETWTKLEGNPYEDSYQDTYYHIGKSRIRFNRNNTNIIYAGDYISYDNGVSWQKSDYCVDAIWKKDNNTIYSVDSAGIYKSKDAGKNWQTIYSGSVDAHHITADYMTEDKLYMGTWSSGIRIFENGKITTYGENAGFVGNSYSFLGFYEVAQDPKNANHLVTCANDSKYNAKSAGIFESYDGGKNWNKIEGTDDFICDAWSVSFHPTLPKVYIGTSNGTLVYEYEKYNPDSNIFFDCDEEYIKELYNDGIIDNRTNGYINLSSNTKRGDYMIWLKKILKIRSKSYDTAFSDVDSFSRYYTAVTAAYENGILSQSSGETFEPHSYLVYSDAIKFAYLAVQYRLENEQTFAKIKELQDDVLLKNAFAYFYNCNAIDDTDIKVTDNICTREQALKLIYTVKCVVSDEYSKYGKKIFNADNAQNGSVYYISSGVEINSRNEFLPSDSQNGNGYVIADFAPLGSYSITFEGYRGYNGLTYFFANQGNNALSLRYSLVFTTSEVEGDEWDYKAILVKSSESWVNTKLPTLAEKGEVVAFKDYIHTSKTYKVKVEYTNNGCIYVYIENQDGNMEKLLSYKDDNPLLGGSCGMRFQGNGNSYLKSVIYEKYPIIPTNVLVDENGVLSGEIMFNESNVEFDIYAALYNSVSLADVKKITLDDYNHFNESFEEYLSVQNPVIKIFCWPYSLKTYCPVVYPAK